LALADKEQLAIPSVIFGNYDSTQSAVPITSIQNWHMQCHNCMEDGRLHHFTQSSSFSYSFSLSEGSMKNKNSVHSQGSPSFINPIRDSILV